MTKNEPKMKVWKKLKLTSITKRSHTSWKPSCKKSRRSSSQPPGFANREKKASPSLSFSLYIYIYVIYIYIYIYILYVKTCLNNPQRCHQTLFASMTVMSTLHQTHLVDGTVAECARSAIWITYNI